MPFAQAGKSASAFSIFFLGLNLIFIELRHLIDAKQTIEVSFCIEQKQPIVNSSLVLERQIRTKLHVGFKIKNFSINFEFFYKMLKLLD